MTAASMRPAALHPAPSYTPLAHRHSRIELGPSRGARQAAHGLGNSITFRRPADLPLCECKPLESLRRSVFQLPAPLYHVAGCRGGTR
jgi:hypothetical protein